MKYNKYNVRKDYDNALKIFYNLIDAKKYARQQAIKLVDRIHVDLFTCDYGIYQYEDTVCSYDPMGKLLN